MCSVSAASRSSVASRAASSAKRTASGVPAISGATAYLACESYPKSSAVSARARIRRANSARFASGPACAARYTRSRASRLSTQRMHWPSVRWSSGTRAREPPRAPPSPSLAAADGGRPASSLRSSSTVPSAFGSRRLRWNAMPCRTTALEARSNAERRASSRWMPPRSKSRRSVRATRAASGESRSADEPPRVSSERHGVAATDASPFALRLSRSTARKCRSCVSTSARYRPRSALSACTYACSST